MPFTFFWAQRGLLICQQKTKKTHEKTTPEQRSRKYDAKKKKKQIATLYPRFSIFVSFRFVSFLSHFDRDVQDAICEPVPLLMLSPSTLLLLPLLFSLLTLCVPLLFCALFRRLPSRDEIEALQRRIDALLKKNAIECEQLAIERDQLEKPRPAKVDRAERKRQKLHRSSVVATAGDAEAFNEGINFMRCERACQFFFPRADDDVMNQNKTKMWQN